MGDSVLREMVFDREASGQVEERLDRLRPDQAKQLDARKSSTSDGVGVERKR